MRLIRGVGEPRTVKLLIVLARDRPTWSQTLFPRPEESAPVKDMLASAGRRAEASDAIAVQGLDSYNLAMHPE